MRHDEERENTTAKEAQSVEADKQARAKDFENHQGDGPSGFDFYQDTKWTC